MNKNSKATANQTAYDLASEYVTRERIASAIYGPTCRLASKLRSLACMYSNIDLIRLNQELDSYNKDNSTGLIDEEGL